MPDQVEYYLVDKKVLPEVFIKVMEVKQRLNTGESSSVNEAVRKTGLSRSAYYKYKDSVLPFYEATNGKKVTLLISHQGEHIDYQSEYSDQRSG